MQLLPGALFLHSALILAIVSVVGGVGDAEIISATDGVELNTVKERTKN